MASNEGEDSHTKGKTIKERLKMMLNNDVMSDVTFVIKDAMEDVVAFKAHKFVLAVSSPVFYAMFYGRLSERKDKIELPDCDSESFLEFLRFLYCDEVNLTGSSVLQVLYLAKKYLVPQLEVACSTFLTENLSSENVFDILPHAKSFEDDELVARCWEVVDVSAQEAVKSETFPSITKELLFEVITRDGLSIHEIELFQAVDRWAAAECVRQDLEPTKDNKRRVTGEDIINNIRFPLMTQAQFAREVPRSGLLPKDEIIELFMWFSSVSISNPKFIKRPRMLYTHSFSRCKRFPQVSHGWGYSSGIPDGLVFSVDTPIVMRGVRLFGSRGYSYEVSLKLYSLVQGRNESDQELFSVEGCFTTDAEYTDGYYGFDVLFDRPVHLEAGVQYRICANISGTSSWYGSSGLNMVECDGICFKFNGQTSPNGTNDSGGQFPQILFHEC